MAKSTAIISLGSNRNPIDSMQKALSLLEDNANISIQKISKFKDYPAIDFDDNNIIFKNCIALIDTDMPIEQFIAFCHNVEAKIGRDSEAKKNRPLEVLIDIDVIVWNGGIIRNKDYNRMYVQDGLYELGL